jgi:hypothetical protein
MPSRNQSSCSQLWFWSRSWGGRHGQADQRVAADDLHGRVHRERHIRRNPAPLSRRANLVRAGASFVGIAFAVLAACPFRGARGKASGGQWSPRLSFQAAPPPQPWPPPCARRGPFSNGTRRPSTARKNASMRSSVMARCSRSRWHPPHSSPGGAPAAQPPARYFGFGGIFHRVTSKTRLRPS